MTVSGFPSLPMAPKMTLAQRRGNVKLSLPSQIFMPALKLEVVKGPPARKDSGLSNGDNQDTWPDAFTASYDLGKTLDAGTVAVVRLASRKSDGKQIAVKCVSSDDEEFRQFTRDEYELVASLSHPAIIRFDGIYEASTRQLICLELCSVHVAVEALRSVNEGETRGNRRRAVRTGAQEERVAAIEALGSYAAAVGARFGEFLPVALPAICAQAGHASPEVRAATARSLERFGRCLGDLASRLPAGLSQDRTAAAGMAQAISRAICGLVAASQNESAAALRSSLQAREDLMDCGSFGPIAGPEAMAAMAAAGAPGQCSDDVESSADEDEADGAEDDS